MRANGYRKEVGRSFGDDEITDLFVKHGYQPLNLIIREEAGYISIDKEGYRSLCQTLEDILNKLENKEAIIKELSSSKINSGDDISTGELKTQLAELQYTNAKIKVDLMNRPDAKEFHKCQVKVRQLEMELDQYRSSVNDRMSDLFSCEQILENIGVLLNVESTDSIIPEIITLQHRVQQIDAIQEELTSVVNIVSGISPPCTPDDIYNHKHWHSICEQLQQWREDSSGIKMLQDVFSDLCHTMAKGDIHNSSPSFHHLTTRQMASLFRHWIRHETHLKSAQYGTLLAMVHHYQELFNVKSMDGIYPSMSIIYRQLQEATTARRNLYDILGDIHTWEGVVNSVWRLVQSRDSKFIISLHQHFPHLSGNEIIQQLSYYHSFFPTFYSLVTELQKILDVGSPSAILPAVKGLCFKKI